MTSAASKRDGASGGGRSGRAVGSGAAGEAASRRPRRAFTIAAALYAAWLIFLLILAVLQR